MEFTGERYVPSQEGQIKYEHLHRYALSLAFVTGKSVMDIASGEGYGAALLASRAKAVTGVDVDRDSVEHAEVTYRNSNLNFIVGSCDSIPLPDASFDVVTSFETIEHHDKHEEMLHEIRRVLTPEGVLIISSPNRLTYSDEPGYTNPFHVKELYYQEFHDLLRRHFKHVRVFGQRLSAGSFVFPLEDSGSSVLIPFTGNADRVDAKVGSLPSPVYFVAICSDSPNVEKDEINSVYLDPANDLLNLMEREKTEQLKQMQDQVSLTEREKTEQLKQMQDQVSLTEREKTEQLKQMQDQVSLIEREKTEQLKRMQDYVRAVEAGIEKERAGCKADQEALAMELRRRDELIDRLARTNEKHLEEHKQIANQLASQITRHAEVLASMLESPARTHGNPRQLVQWSERWQKFEQKLRRASPSPVGEVFQGFFDYPKAGDVVSDVVDIYGWVYSRAAPVRSVQAFLNDTYLGIVRYGEERLDVAAAFPGVAPLGCGYQERFVLNGLEVTGEIVLRIVVYDAKGNKQSYSRTVTRQQRSAPPLTALSSSLSETTSISEVAPSIDVEAPAAERSGQIRNLVAEFQQRFGRDPVILEWLSGLSLSTAFPSLAICAPPVLKNTDNTLPYLDGSFDIVIMGESAEPSEAKRVAAVAVVYCRRDTLEVEWQTGSIDEPVMARTSIVIPVYNNVSYTKNCLQKLVQTLPHNFDGEIIVVDDCSSDGTAALLEDWAAADSRITVLRNSENAGFINSCNKGAAAATGEVLMFLNNDTLPSAGWLPPLLHILRDKPDAGAVGGKLIYPDGTLQEAGGVIFSDGSGCNFGKYDKSPNAPLYSFVREVDYCSGAMLATRRALFMELGGFDTRFIPAYYEDTDYCFTLREHGYRVYYQPESVVMHFEGASSGTDINAGVKSYQAVNRTKFVEKWKETLKYQPPPPVRYDLTTLHALSIRETLRNAHGN